MSSGQAGCGPDEDDVVTVRVAASNPTLFTLRRIDAALGSPPGDRLDVQGEVRVAGGRFHYDRRCVDA